MPARRRPSKKASSCLDNYNDDQQRRMAARPDGSHRRWNKRNIAYGAALIATLLIVAVVLLAVLLPDTNHDSNTGSTTTTTTTTTNDASTAAPVRTNHTEHGRDDDNNEHSNNNNSGGFQISSVPTQQSSAQSSQGTAEPLSSAPSTTTPTASPSLRPSVRLSATARNKHSTGNYRVHNQQTWTMYSLLVFLSFLFAYTCIQTKPPPRRNITTMGTFELLETVPHDANAFTQGLQSVPDDRTTTASTTSTTSKMYESTGLYGASDVRIVDVATGGVLLKTELQSQFFGEGLTYYVDSLAQEGRLVQLTWKEQTGFVYDPTTLVQLSNFTYKTFNTEGWGITYRADQNIFYVTDGSTFVHTWNVEFQEIAKVPVTMQNTATSNPSTLNLINELEWDVNSRTLLANVWMQDVLIRIQPETGFVTTVYDLTTLFLNRPNSADVLNGIALTDVPDELWVTGKLWPNMYRIRLIG
jgi:glutamine cyclotransferase